MVDRSVYPRPEYPRPDFQRGTVEGVDWLNLNGPWQFRFDGERRGLQEAWFLPQDLEWREQIIVPFCWESLAAWGEGDTAGNENYYATRVFRNPIEVNRSNHSYAPRYEVGWYRRQVEIPGSWQGKRIILKVGAADFFTDCWCNGVHLGQHEGGYIPFEFDITDTLTRQEDGRCVGLVVLRVEDPMDNNEQPVGKQWHWYTSTSGIWQTVYVEPRETAHLDSFRVVTDLDQGTAAFHVESHNAPEGAEVQLRITSPEKETQVETLVLQDNVGSNKVSLNKVYVWNPNQPHLYRLEFTLRHGEKVLDVVHSYFGMRKIDSSPGENAQAPALLRLNNIPRYLRGALYQSYFPDGVYTAGDVSTLKEDIRWAKKFGFNFLRIHIKIDDPLMLYYADTLGIMLMADFPNFGEGGDTPMGRRRFETMMKAAIKRDFNHPSIVAWCVFNETWGFGGQLELIKHFPSIKEKNLQRRMPVPAPEAKSATGNGTEKAPVLTENDVKEKLRLGNISSHLWVQTMWDLVKKLDPTRLVEDMSVVHWEHLDYFAHGETDINSWHFYIDDYDKAKEHIAKIVRSSYAGSSFNFVPGFQDKGQPLINSEYGGVGALDGDRDVSWTFKFLTNELRRHSQISAYIYTELTDVEWEYNGFLNYDRTPKQFGYDPKIINESNVLPINAPPISRVPVGTRVTVEVVSSHFATEKCTGVRMRWKLSGIDGSGRIHQDLATGIVPIPFPHRQVALAHNIELQLPQTTMLCTLTVEAVKPDGAQVASNFIHYYVDGGPLPLREDQGRTLVLRRYPHEWSRAEWSGPMSSPDEACRNDACYGSGHGFFEWIFPLDGVDLSRARRLRLLCEVSSHRSDTPQTDDDHYPTTLHMQLNDIPIYEHIIINHPHDSRGALSYLRGGRGAYGYLVHAAAEGELLHRIQASTTENQLRLRCQVPSNEWAVGGLVVYGSETGRYPVCLTLLVEW